MCSNEGVRWEAQALDADDIGALPGLSRLSGFVRSVRSPEFDGVTFHEVLAKSALNKVPGSSPMPFSWTVNPYRGCSHGCTYCFARRTHAYLELDTGHDFDTQIVVKTNIGAVLARELAGPRWQREQVAMGTNTDPYQRAEGRYQLMPGVIEALAASGTPFSILTKGTVLARDLPLLSRVGRQVPVGMGVSLALLDRELQATLEPGTPSPQARLGLVRKITEAGLPCGVLVAPLLPYLTDRSEQIVELVGELVDAGATGISGIVLHLRPGAREWFFGWLGQHHPELVEPYQRLYARGANAPSAYRRMIADRVRQAKARFGLGSSMESLTRGVPGDGGAAFPAGSLPDLSRATAAAVQPPLF